MTEQKESRYSILEYEKRKRERATKKDVNFLLSGRWKRYVKDVDSFQIFAVDGEWVRNNLSVIFGAGGHGYVHEFIPLSEIWVSTHHYEGCGCDNLKSANQEVSQQYFDSTVIHEITEFQAMMGGRSFWEAHEIALAKENEIGILKDPHTEVD